MQNETERHIISGLKILHGESWLIDYAVILEGKVIKALIPAAMIKHHLPAKQTTFSGDFYLVPGFIDMHIHGASGSDVMDGTLQALQTISQALAKEGVTSFLATTMTEANEKLEQVLKVVPEAMQKVEGAAILGIHLEGPFIAEFKMGAQCKDHIKAPNIQLFKRWQELSHNTIKVVTLAPELPNALEVISYLKSTNVIASVGHTNATFEVTCAAIQAGCSQATHLFNAMRGFHQREPGAAGALLLSDAVMGELIADGVHLHPAMVELAFRVKGNKHLLLVTDAMRAKCCVSGEYELGGQKVLVQNGCATLADGTLGGSVLTIPQAIKHIIQYAQCNLEEAMLMASRNPAEQLKVARTKGSIEIGKDADLVVLNGNLEVVLTLREGKEIYKA